MSTSPEIRVIATAYGPLPSARSLNPRFSSREPLLLATLDVVWSPVDPVAAVARLEGALLAFSPGFARHECRGAEVYHVFAPARGQSPAAGDGFEAPLALTHLIEHAVIDFQCAITGARRCSGITAARRRPIGRFDLMVECSDPHLGRCCLALAVAWVSAAAQGLALGAPQRETLAAARLAYAADGRALQPKGVAAALGWSERQAGRALAALSQVGYLVSTPFTVNLSGIPEYRLGRS
jgi:hypothetical protein